MTGKTAITSLQRSIRDAREKLGLTQDEFAQQLGVSSRTVARWEAGDSAPHTTSHKIALHHVFKELGMGRALKELALAEHVTKGPSALAGAALGALALTNPIVGAAAGVTALGALMSSKNSAKALTSRTAQEGRASPFAKQARVFQGLTNAADELQMDVEEVSKVVRTLADELEKHGISLADIRKVLS